MRGYRCLTRIYKDRGEIPLDKKAFWEKFSLFVYTEIFFFKSDSLEHVSLHVISAVFTECPLGGFALFHSEFQSQMAKEFGR